MIQDGILTYIIHNYGNILQKLGLAVIALIIMYSVSKNTAYIVEKKIIQNALQQNKYILRTASLIRQIVFIFLLICSILISMEIIGFNTAIIIGGVTVALGFAMETTIKNMISGIFLLTNPHIKVGNTAKLLGKMNTIAKIEEFHIRYTVVKTITKQRIIIPNSQLVHTPIQTKKSENIVRGEITISIGRQYDLELVKSILYGCIQSHDSIIHKDKILVQVRNFNAKGYELVCYYFYSPQQTKKVDFVINAELRKMIRTKLTKNNIQFSYPRTTIGIRPED